MREEGTFPDPRPKEIIIRRESTQIIYDSPLVKGVEVLRVVGEIARRGGPTRVILNPDETVPPVFKRFEPDDGKPRTVYLAIWDHDKTPVRPIVVGI